VGGVKKRSTQANSQDTTIFQVMTMVGTSAKLAASR
jgi:hypothetical protein